ncbi:hypothetical protein B0H17DRAFT_1133127 [Mycena rosella]|uniref:Uncharacterized protein n=1 Tax=Mycena rosella TaxID=1033263 RepID=A0AAD7DIU5_MYCRO|nr:hypothetical protein B0H17DRAFT_1133127 [Mycena rosella]
MEGNVLAGYREPFKISLVSINPSANFRRLSDSMLILRDCNMQVWIFDATIFSLHVYDQTGCKDEDPTWMAEMTSNAVTRPRPTYWTRLFGLPDLASDELYLDICQGPKILRRPHTMRFTQKSPVENERSAGASTGVKDGQAKLNGLINSGASAELG